MGPLKPAPQKHQYPYSASIGINKRILAQNRDWRGILSVYSVARSKYNHVNWATTISRLGKATTRVGSAEMKRSDAYHALISELSERMTASPDLADFGEVRGVANILHGLAKLKPTINLDIQFILNAAERNADWIVENGNPQEISNTVWAFATLKVPAPNLLRKIDERAVYLVENGDPQNLSNIAWACATMKIPANNTFRAIGDQPDMSAFVRSCGAQEIANLAWAFATLEVPSPDLFKCIDEQSPVIVSAIMRNARPQEMANLAWAFASVNNPTTTTTTTTTLEDFAVAPQLLKEIEERASFLVENGKPRDIANAAWAFAKLKVPAPRLFEKIDEHSSAIVENGKPQEIANIAWAFATFNIPAPLLINHLQKRAKAFVAGCGPQELANIAWALATLKVSSKKLFKHIHGHGSVLVEKGSPQEIANAAWAFSTLNLPAPILFKRINQHSLTIIESAQPRNIANIAWAFAKLRYDCPELLSVTDSRSECIIQRGDAQNVANVAWAFAVLRVTPEKFFDCLEANVDQFLRTATEYSLCTVCWSLVVLDLGRRNEALLQELWGRAMSLDAKSFTQDGLRNLASVALHARASRVELLSPVPPVLQQRMAEAASTARGRNTSEFGREYSELLAEMGFEHERGASPVGGSSFGNLFSIDMACRSRMIAVECDGPYHFLSSYRENYLGGGRRPKENGGTVAKRRLLERLGWRVINVSYVDDTVMNKTGDSNKRRQKKEFLRRKLEELDANI
jgi:hypothetical protein